MLRVILGFIVKALIPQRFLELSEFKSDEVEYVTEFVDRSIRSAPFVIRVPEKFLRIIIFLIILCFNIWSKISETNYTVDQILQMISKIHPIFDDGIRLYRLLVFFAAFETKAVKTKFSYKSLKD